MCTPLSAPVIAATRLRGWNAHSARGAASFVAEAVGAARAAGCTGTIVVRMDSAYYAAAVIAAIRRAGALFSVTVKMDRQLNAAIAAIPETAWTPISTRRPSGMTSSGPGSPTPRSPRFEDTAFASSKGKAVTARPIACWSRPEKQAAACQDQPFSPRYHARLHRLPVRAPAGRGQHCDHVVVEQVFADLTYGPLAHLPSGSIRRERGLSHLRRHRA